MAVLVVEQLEMVDVDEQQRQRLAGPLRAQPFGFERLVEGAAVGKTGQAVLGGERLQGRLGALLVGHVAQGLDDRDQIAGLVMDRAGVDGEIEVAAELRHHAPVLGGKAGAVVAVDGEFGIELGELVGPAERHEIGKAVSAPFVERAPVLAGADHLGGRDAGQPLAGPVPDHDAPLRIDDESRDDQMLHQPHRIGMRDVRAPCACHPQVLSPGAVGGKP